MLHCICITDTQLIINMLNKNQTISLTNELYIRERKMCLEEIWVAHVPPVLPPLHIAWHNWKQIDAENSRLM